MSEKVRHYNCVNIFLSGSTFFQLWSFSSCFVLPPPLAKQLAPSCGRQKSFLPLQKPSRKPCLVPCYKQIRWELFRTLLCGSLSSCWTLQSPISRWHPRRISEFSSLKKKKLYQILYNCNFEKVKKNWPERRSWWYRGWRGKKKSSSETPSLLWTHLRWSQKSW